MTTPATAPRPGGVTMHWSFVIPRLVAVTDADGVVTQLTPPRPRRCVCLGCSHVMELATGEEPPRHCPSCGVAEVVGAAR